MAGTNDTMKAVQIQKYGGDEVLEYVETQRPAPGPGQVLVNIHAAGLNYFDVKIREGWLREFFPVTLPHILGTDFAGEVVALGEGATTYEVGDRVYGMITPFQGGTYAEYLAVDERIIRPAPANVDFVEAAGLPLVGVTAWIALVDLGQIKEGHNVLVHAGSGAVGGATIQLARYFGANVVATCSGRNLDFVRTLGAGTVIDYTTTDFREAVGDVDIAVDVIGGDTNLRTYEVMRPGGTIAVVLRNDPVEIANRERLCQEYGVSVKVVAFDLIPEYLDNVRELVEAGHMHGNVQSVFPLSEARQAHQISQTRHARGKIVLKVQ